MLADIESLVSSKIHLMQMVWSMFKLESRLAGLSVYPVMLHLVLLLVVYTSTWLSLLFLGGYFIATTLNSLPLAIASVLGLNVIVLFILTMGLKYHLKNMSFEKTRLYFINQKDKDEQTTIAKQHSNTTTAITDNAKESVHS